MKNQRRAPSQRSWPNSAIGIKSGSETAKSLPECKTVPPCAEHKEIPSIKHQIINNFQSPKIQFLKHLAVAILILFGAYDLYFGIFSRSARVESRLSLRAIEDLDKLPLKQNPAYETPLIKSSWIGAWRFIRNNNKQGTTLRG